MSQRYAPSALARLSFAVAARETADACYGLVAHVADPDVDLDEDLVRVREMRALSAITWQRKVLALLLRGPEPAWGRIAAAIGWSEGSLRAQYEDVVDLWRRDPATIDLGQATSEATIGQVNDGDPVGTAHSLDLWLQRHRDPWDADPERSDPVTYALTSG